MRIPRSATALVLVGAVAAALAIVGATAAAAGEPTNRGWVTSAEDVQVPLSDD